MHFNVLGQSMSGKTWLVQYMGRKISKDMNVAVYSPHYFGGEDFKKEFGATFITNDEKEIIKYAWTHTDHLILLDESTDKFKDEICRKLLTQNRHLGNQIGLIAHRFTRLDKTMRDMCDLLFCFQVDIDDSKELAKSFIDENLLDLYKQSKFNCRVSIKSEPENQHAICTKEKSGLTTVDRVCQRLVREAPVPNTELVKAIGIHGHSINWEFLKEKGYIY